MFRKSRSFTFSTIAAAICALGASAAAQKLEYQYCNQVPSALQGTCEAACYKQRYDDLRERAKCVDAWAKTGIPPHPCRAPELMAACETFKAKSCNVYEKADPTGHSGLWALTRFSEQVAKYAEVLPAAQLLQANAQCLGAAAYREHKKQCTRETKPARVEKCVALSAQVKERWATAIKKIVEKLVPAGIAAAEKGPGYGGRVGKAFELAEKAVETAAQKNEHPLLKTDFDVAGLKAKLAEAKAKGEAAVKAASEKRKKESEDRADAEAEETRAPKAKMRNAKLAKKIRAIIERQWPKDDFKQVILSSKKWSTNYVYIGNYRTSRLRNKTLNAHVITRPAKAKHCRLYNVMVEMPRWNKKWGEVSWGGVGDSKWIKCPGGDEE